ncbi:GAF domain-containing protein [Desulfococcaceae bacterium HSG9]|nr:GAF domain-containing protein [Desulfococcaceae bacterium HSG9]
MLEILLIEDNDDDAHFIESALDKQKYHVKRIINGELGFQYLLQPDVEPDVVLLDYHLPLMDGLEIIRKTNERGKDYAFLFLTIDNTVEIAVKAMKAGALDFLPKTGKYFSNLPDMIDKIYNLQNSRKEKEKAEEALKIRTRELALLNSAARSFVSSLELEQVFATVLDEVGRIIGILTCSIWLVDPDFGDLVCREAIPPKDDIVRGWRMAAGQGLVGWVLQHGEILNIADTRTDKRHFKGVDKQTGLKLRSILSVPLQTKNGTFGVLQLLDEAENRFGTNDEHLAESLAAMAAIAIENANLYRQTQQDAETKTILLQEVNHRVKNNLIAITGMLYIEQRFAAKSPERTDAAILDNLACRIKGLSVVYQMLSDYNWIPLPLSVLARQLIDEALHELPPERQVSVDIVTDTSVVMSPEEAHHIAIVINELVANVIKHVAIAKRTSQLTVHIKPEPLSKAVLLEFRDNGPGFPEAVLNSEIRNVGLYLVENTVRHSLRGEITLCNNNGAVVKIRFTTVSLLA